MVNIRQMVRSCTLLSFMFLSFFLGFGIFTFFTQLSLHVAFQVSMRAGFKFQRELEGLYYFVECQCTLILALAAHKLKHNSAIRTGKATR